LDVKEAVLKRKSIRAFDANPVPKDVLKQIMEGALWAPSWGNTQPWGLTLVSGQPLTLIKKESLRLVQQEEKPRPEIAMPFQWEEAHRIRYQRIGKGIFDTLGIQRDEREKRKLIYEQMAFCFNAPHMIYVDLHQGFNPYALLDCGLIMQTITLLAVEQGLGTCLMAVAVHYPEVIRRYALIPEGRILVLGIALGYTADKHPINHFRSGREKPGELIRWVDG
jgi:nitroreductase